MWCSVSSAHTVVIRNVSVTQPWVSNRLFLLRSNVRVEFAPGAFLLAKRDTVGICESASMLELHNVTNVSIVGVRGGVKPTIRGWKWDHLNNTFGCAGSDRMGITMSTGGMLTHNNVTYNRPQNWKEYSDFGWCHQITVENLNIQLSGGDGIYLEGCSSVRLADLNVR